LDEALDDVIRFDYLIRGERMVNCTKKQIRELRTALRWKMPEAQRQRIQMVLLRESGMARPAIAAAMGVSLSTANRAHMAPSSIPFVPILLSLGSSHRWGGAVSSGCSKSKVAKDIFDRLDRGRPPIEKAQRISPSQKLLNFLQHWGKPTVCTREILIYGPRSLRNPISAIASAETLVKYGWLVPAKKRRRDMRKWEIVRRPVIPPTIDPTIAT
jgi:hypothetical protein